MMTMQPSVLTTIEFSSGLPGFPDATHFELRPWGDESDDNPFWLLDSLDRDDLAFVVCPPWTFYPEYDFNLDDLTAARIGLRSPTDVIALSIVTVGDRPEDSTINLLGPLIINRNSGDAVQVVLSEVDFDVRAPLVRA